MSGSSVRSFLVIASDSSGATLKKLIRRKPTPDDNPERLRNGKVYELASLNPDYDSVELLEEGMIQGKVQAVVGPGEWE